MKPESKLQNNIQRALKSRFSSRPYRSYWWKNHGSVYSKGGLPDIMGVCNGVFFAFEVKMPGEEPTKRQERALHRLDVAGGVSEVVESISQAEFIVELHAPT